MTCRDAEWLLHDALDAPLPPADAAALAAHLETCAACRDVEADLALLHGAAESLDPPIVPAQAWTRLSTQLEREGLMASAAATPSRTTWRGYAWMALAASLLAGVGASLPEAARAAFLLHDVEGFDHREVGTILGIAEGTSKSQVHKARLRIRGFLHQTRTVTAARATNGR